MRFDSDKDASQSDPVAIYDRLTELGLDAAVFKLGDRCIVGRWVSTWVIKKDLVLTGKPKAVEVLGEADNWIEAEENAMQVIERSGWKSAKLQAHSTYGTHGQESK